MIRTRASLVAAFIGLSAIFSAAHASSVSATVNNELITSYEIAQRQKLMTISGSKSGGAVNELVDEKIKLGAARKLGVIIKEDEVDRAFSLVAERSKLSPVQLTQALSGRGVDTKTLKDRLRAELAWRQVVQVRYARNSPMQPSENDMLSNFVLVSPKENKGFVEYSIARVVVVSDAAGVAAARRKANSLSKSIASCEGLKDKFKTQNDVVVFEPTTRTSKELPESVVESLNKTKIGHATQAYDGTNGIEVGVVCARKTIGGTDIVSKKNVDKENQIQKKLEEISVSYLKELKQDAVIDIKK